MQAVSFDGMPRGMEAPYAARQIVPRTPLSIALERLLAQDRFEAPWVEAAQAELVALNHLVSQTNGALFASDSRARAVREAHHAIEEARKNRVK